VASRGESLMIKDVTMENEEILHFPRFSGHTEEFVMKQMVYLRKTSFHNNFSTSVMPQDQMGKLLKTFSLLPTNYRQRPSISGKFFYNALQNKNFMEVY
jgi:hypothetical protein